MRSSVLLFKSIPMEDLMKARLLIAALLVAGTPGIALAFCSGSHDQMTMSCPEGQVFDTETQTCTPMLPVTS